MKWIAANDLTNWSSSPSARDDLPALVGDLIRASVDSMGSFRFPSGDVGNARGFDGHLICDTGGLIVPEGESYWEFKTGQNAWDEGLEAFREYSKRLSESTRRSSTFILVSSRLWNSSNPKKQIQDWVTLCKGEYAWKDVQWLDASALESWLDTCQAVAAKFARTKLSLKPQRGARSTEEFWDEFRHLFERPLVEEVLLCDRAKEAGQLVDALLRPNGTTYFVSDSVDEVIAFGVAAIRSAKPEVRDFLEARTVVVDEMEAGRELVPGDNLIFFLRGTAAERSGYFSEKGPTLVPLGRQQRGSLGQLLERPTVEAMAAALEKMKYERGKAILLARGSGRSIVALRRQIPGGHVSPPKWLDDVNAILPAIMAGAWDGANDMDRVAISALAQTEDYYGFEKRLRPLLKSEDPPLDQLGTIWAVRAPMDAFLHAGGQIGPEVLDTLQAVMLQVFGHVPPPPDPLAFVRLDREKADAYSDWLRDGLATTLLQIAVWDKLSDMPPPEGGGQRFANQVVTSIPGLAADTRVLISLKNQLPYLAEAAPDPLLSALELMLGGNGNVLRPLFDEVEGFIHPVSQHTGLLWALETLAWDPDYFERATMVLANLAVLDPGGKLSNRPINSLGDIFLPWHPNTKASLNLRLAVLDRICATLPDVGWKLVAKMLPTMRGISTGTARPKLREAASGEITVTYAQFWEAQSAAVQRAISLAGTDVGRWETLIPALTNFMLADRELALIALDSALAKLPDDSTKTLVEDLRREVERHERFPDAKWVLPPDQLAPLRALVDKYASDDPLENARLIFDSWSFDANGRRDSVAKDRQDVLKSILHAFGPKGIVTLGQSVKSSYSMLEQLGTIEISKVELEEAATLSVSDEPGGLTVGLITILYHKFGVQVARDWIVRVQKTIALSDWAVAQLLTALPDTKETWHFASSISAAVETEYWSSKGPYQLKGNREELLAAIDAYILFGRGIAALAASLQRLSEVPSSTILRMLEAVVSDLNSRSDYDVTMVSYEIELAFNALDERTDVSVEEIARHEIMLFPLLEHTQHRMRVFQVMATNPDVYFDILKAVFRADDEPESTKEASDSERSLWRLNYSLLSKFNELPGRTSTGIDSAALSHWIVRVRELANVGRRVAIADQYIGHVLARSAPGNDELWPAVEVRDQIEAFRSDDIEQGIRIERSNMRGSSMRAMYAGGDQERDLARKYYDYASSITSWPRTQALLRSIAKNWEADAARQDEWAEQRKLKSQR